MPVGYTERFTETHRKLAVIYPASYNSEQNTAFVDVGGFHRIFVHVIAGDIGTSIDVDIEIATDSAAAGLLTLKSITQLTQAGGDDDSDVGIEIQAEELSYPTGAAAADLGKYHWLRVEVTPSGSCLLAVVVYGVPARFSPVDVTNWDEIKD
jgi:hypothetical protein